MQELLEKIRHYLDHPQQRADLALAGQRRTLSEHLYSHRLPAALEHVNQARTAAQLMAPHEPRRSCPPALRSCGALGAGVSKNGATAR